MSDVAKAILKMYIIKAKKAQPPADFEHPVGYIAEWVGGIPPHDFLICNGRQYLNNQYPDLARMLEGKYGGITPPSRHWRWVGLYGFLYRRWLRGGYFNVPDLRNRVMIGVDPAGEQTSRS